MPLNLTDRRGRCPCPKQSVEKILILRLREWVRRKIDIVLSFEPRWGGGSPRGFPQDRDEFPLISVIEHLGGHDVALVPHSSDAIVRSVTEFPGAHDQDIVALTDCFLHELGQLISGHEIPPVKDHLDAIFPKPNAEIAHPILVGVAVPRV
jgi:hypothetical protein